MGKLDKLKRGEDRFIAAVQHPAVARILTAIVAAVIVAHRVRPDWTWPMWIIEGGAALGIYGSIHREQKE